jgi:hypothetical protein
MEKVVANALNLADAASDDGAGAAREVVVVELMTQNPGCC